MTEIGHLAAFVAAGLALVSCWGGLRGNDRLATRSALVVLALLGVAFLVLVRAFVISDFSVALVVSHSHADKPLFYKVAASWGNHEGSMLLWCLVTALYGGAAAAAMRSGPLKARALGVQGLLTALSCFYLLFASNPFLRLDVPPLDGRGLNPLLQDPALAFHPPLLYLGYVGFSFVFSLAAAGLLAPRSAPANDHVGPEWAAIARPWILGAFAALSGGIALGSIWAYYELGWGGWWFWDPVENASLMPWLAGAALLHSAKVTARDGGLAGWTVFLSFLAFTLSLLGAFLVRSGILTSVHTFALDPERGLYLLGGTVLVSGAAFALMATRLPGIGTGPVPRPFSRGGALVANNLFLSVAAGTVLIGTLYPLFVEAMTDEKVSVGAPYFVATLAPVMAPMLLLPPIAMFLRWGRGGLRNKPALAALGVTAAMAAMTWAIASGRPWTSLAAGLALWLVGGSVASLWQKAARGGWRRALHPASEGLGAALAHAGLGLLALGAVTETQGRIERTFAMDPGQSVQFADWTLTFQGVALEAGPNYEAQIGTFEVERDGRRFLLRPEKRFYQGSDTAPTTEVAIRRGLASHLYTALGEPVRDRPGAWTMRVSFNPLIELVFTGMLLIAFGGLSGLARRVDRQARSPHSRQAAPAALAKP